MPPPLLLAPFGQLSFAAAKRAAASAIVSVDVYALSTTAFAYILGVLAWKQIPDWIKEDVSLRALLPKNGTTTQETLLELNNLASVIEKLQALLESGSEKLVSCPVPYLHVTILAYIQLAAQLRTLHPEVRNVWYGGCGNDATIDSFEKVGDDEAVTLMKCLDYSTLSYESDTENLLKSLGKDFQILQHNTMIQGIVRPGYLGHYTAISIEKKLVVIGIRGTSSLEELLTDLCGKAVCLNGNDEDLFHSRVEVSAAGPNELRPLGDGNIEIISGHERIWMEAHHDDDCNNIRCHQGILICAIRLVNEAQRYIEKYIVQGGYRLLLCGHSLGAGVASVTAILLRIKYAELADAGEGKMKVVAFAPPPILDHDTAFATSSYTTTVVNNSDIIPRSSLANLAIFLELLRELSSRLQERGLIPTNPFSAAAFIQKITSDASSSDDLLMTLEEVNIAIEKAHNRVELRNPDHLYVPGRVLIMYEKNKEHVAVTSDVVADDPMGQWSFIATDGSAAALRFVDMDALRIVTDHGTASYAKSLNLFYPTDDVQAF